MMDFNLLFLLLFVSVVFIILGFVRKQYLLVLFGSIFFLFAGVFTLNGIQMQTGSLVVETSTNTTTVSNVYTTYYSVFPNPFGMGFALVGLALLIMSILWLFDKKGVSSSSEDDDLDE